jgi:hypothetical protein
MSESMTQDQLTVSYNPNLLVTYKAIPETYAAPESPTFMTDKVTDIEWSLHQARNDRKTVDANFKQMLALEELLVELYNPNYDKSEVLQQITELFGWELKKTVSVSGTISFEVEMEVPIDEVEDLSSYDYVILPTFPKCPIYPVSNYPDLHMSARPVILK